MLPTKFQFIWTSGFGEDFFLEIDQPETRIAYGSHVCLWIGTKCAIFITTFNRCFLPSFGLFGQAVSEKKIFRNQPIRSKNCLWWPCLLTDRAEMSNIDRGFSIDASYQILVHLAKQFQRRRFLRNQLIRNKNCLWRPCLLTDWN
jgi:hypothetical protein